MKTFYDGENSKKGKLLGQGKSIENLLDLCYKNKWTSKNTILEVKDDTDLDSKWKIYERK